MQRSDEEWRRLEFEFNRLSGFLETLEGGTKAFQETIAAIQKLGSSGYLEAGELLAEVHATEESVLDPEEAYKWYYISLKLEGYSTDFQNRSDSEGYYHGPVGDFRNEGMVYEIILKIGLQKARELDEQAEHFFREHEAGFKQWASQDRRLLRLVPTSDRQLDR